MSLTAVFEAWTQAPDVRRVLAEAGRSRLVDISSSDGARPFLITAIPRAPRQSAPLLVVTATTREAEDLQAALGGLLPSDEVAVFPSWETLPHERLSPRSDTVGRRLAVLRRITHPDPDDTAYGPLSVVIAPVRAALQPLTKGLGDLEPVSLQAR